MKNTSENAEKKDRIVDMNTKKTNGKSVAINDFLMQPQT